MTGTVSVGHLVARKGGVTTDTNGRPECGPHNRYKSDTAPDDHPDRAPPEAA